MCRERRDASLGHVAALAGQGFQSLRDEFSTQHGQVIDEEQALEMIMFMLDDASQEIVVLDDLLAAVKILIAEPDPNSKPQHAPHCRGRPPIGLPRSLPYGG